MTEPPDPRHSEEGGGDEDYDAIWENADADEIMGGLEDDVLLDSIAQGVRGDLGPDQLTELLSGLRDEPDATDIPVPNLGRVERGENVLEPPGPRQSTEGATSEMSVSDSIAQLNQVAGNTTAAGALTQALSSLEQSALAQLQEAVTRLVENKDAAMGALDGTAGEGIGQLQGAAEHAAGAIEDAMELVNAAIAGINQAAEHEAAFRQVATEVAGRLGSA